MRPTKKTISSSLPCEKRIHTLKRHKIPNSNPWVMFCVFQFTDNMQNDAKFPDRRPLCWSLSPQCKHTSEFRAATPRRGRSLAPGLQDTPVSSLCTPARCGCWWGCEMCGSKCAVVSGSWFRVQSSSHLSGLTGVSSLNVNANNWRQTPKHIFLS